MPGAHRQDARPVPVGDQGQGAMRWLPSSRRVRRLEAMRPGACRFFCVCGLEVGGDPVGVGSGELGEGLFPVGGGLALDEAGWGGAFAGGFALVLVAFAGALVAVAGLLATVV